MSEDITEELDSQNQSSEEDVNTTDVDETGTQSGTEDTEQPEYTERETELYERLQKALGKVKDPATGKWFKPAKPAVPPKKEPQSPPSDTGSLTIKSVREFKAISDLEDDDAEYVANYAEKFGMTLSEARKDKDVKAVLSVRAEERRTAAATNTGPARRGTSKVSDEALLEKANRGDIPDDEESLMRLARARMQKKAQ